MKKIIITLLALLLTASCSSNNKIKIPQDPTLKTEYNKILTDSLQVDVIDYITAAVNYCNDAHRDSTLLDDISSELERESKNITKTLSNLKSKYYESQDYATLGSLVEQENKINTIVDISTYNMSILSAIYSDKNDKEKLEFLTEKTTDLVDKFIK